MPEAQSAKPRASQIDDDVIGRMVKHLRQNTTDMAPSDLHIPAAHFLSNEHALTEKAVLRRLPLVVGQSSELSTPGSFFTRRVLGQPLLVVRKADGKVRAYLNICRHRGAQVEQAESGSKALFVCPYHGWTYEREEGRLRGVPFEEMFEDVDKSCNGLKQVQVQERHGLIWVQFDKQRDLAEWLGPADDHVAAFALDGAEVVRDEKFELDINWKLVLEGAIDGSHVQFLHRDSVANYIQNNACVWGNYGHHGSLIMTRKKFALHVQAGGDLEGAWKNFSSNLFIFPNTMIMAAPDHVEFWTVWPNEKRADRCTVSIRFLIQPDRLDERIRNRMDKSWEILQNAAANEDFPAEAGIQANLFSAPDTTLIYGRHEIGCQHIHRELAREVSELEAEER